MTKPMRTVLAVVSTIALLKAELAAAEPMPGWPAEVKEIRYRSTADGTEQPALFYAPADLSDPVPLLVGLHSWSADYQQKSSVPYAEWCRREQWAFIHPNFRGPNNHPAATGSELVVRDILSAVQYARDQAKIDPARIYLVGASGGGYTALLMAGRMPGIWAGVSAWVPITDLKAWHEESVVRKQKYAQDIVKSCGGTPGQSAEVDIQYALRSPLTHLSQAIGVPIDINAGIKDGHTGSVPISHSLRAFNVLAEPKDRLSDETIASMTAKAAVPESLQQEAIDDPAYGTKKVLFRRQSGQVRITVFDGGHEIIPEAALRWLSQQRQN